MRFFTARSLGFALSPLVTGLVLLLTGCATKTTPPPQTTTLNDLYPGADRDEVVARFGQPESSVPGPNGSSVETFKFVEGDPVVNPSTKDSAKLDAAIIPSSEVTSSMAQTGQLPSSMLEGDTLTVQVNYDKNDTVENIHLIVVTPEKAPAPAP
jgi:hypothetical protein